MLERVVMGIGFVVMAGGTGMSIAVAKAGALYSTGLVVVVVGVLIVGWSLLSRQFRQVTGPADDAYTLGYQIGYDRGYIEGHAIARPVVVPMASASTCLDSDDARRIAEHTRRKTDVCPKTTLGQVAGNDPAT